MRSVYPTFHMIYSCKMSLDESLNNLLIGFENLFRQFEINSAKVLKLHKIKQRGIG